MGSRRVVFGEFEFDVESGELHRRGRADDDEPQRLPPQPARLLSLLVERNGGLVTRDEIREHIWPDVRIDFDRSLHFCVRQVRSALGDSATEPRYIENLPRRGYRLKPAVEPVEAGDVCVTRQQAKRWPFVAAPLVLAAVLLAAWIFTGGSGPVVELRIAVMPFAPPAGMQGFEHARPIAEWVLEDLTLAAGDRAGIVGPTSTSGYDDSSGSLRRLAAEYELQYIVNGRFIESESGPRMLAELIRVSDGAHIWVRAYDDLSEGQRIGKEISRNVARELGL